jgi:hypothetical protein
MTNKRGMADRQADIDAPAVAELSDGKTAAPVRILIADDDEDSLALVTKCLSWWGYEAVAAKDGMEALAALSAEDAPALAILDWTMPGLDGIERQIVHQPRIMFHMNSSSSECAPCWARHTRRNDRMPDDTLRRRTPYVPHRLNFM